MSFQLAHRISFHTKHDTTYRISMQRILDTTKNGAISLILIQITEQAYDQDA